MAEPLRRPLSEDLSALPPISSFTADFSSTSSLIDDPFSEPTDHEKLEQQTEEQMMRQEIETLRQALPLQKSISQAGLSEVPEESEFGDGDGLRSPNTLRTTTPLLSTPKQANGMVRSQGSPNLAADLARAKTRSALAARFADGSAGSLLARRSPASPLARRSESSEHVRPTVSSPLARPATAPPMRPSVARLPSYLPPIDFLAPPPEIVYPTRPQRSSTAPAEPSVTRSRATAETITEPRYRRGLFKRLSMGGLSLSKVFGREKGIPRFEIVRNQSMGSLKSVDWDPQFAGFTGVHSQGRSKSATESPVSFRTPVWDQPPIPKLNPVPPLSIAPDNDSDDEISVDECIVSATQLLEMGMALPADDPRRQMMVGAGTNAIAAYVHCKQVELQVAKARRYAEEAAEEAQSAFAQAQQVQRTAMLAQRAAEVAGVAAIKTKQMQAECLSKAREVKKDAEALRALMVERDGAK